jgi:hypothetical protein
MTLRTRLGVVAALVVVVLLAVGVLLPRIVRSSLIDQVDHQLDAAIPIALELSRDLGTSAADRRPPAATRLSELYVARVPSGTATARRRSRVAVREGAEGPGNLVRLSHRAQTDHSRISQRLGLLACRA